MKDWRIEYRPRGRGPYISGGIGDHEDEALEDFVTRNIDGNWIIDTHILNTEEFSRPDGCGEVIALIEKMFTTKLQWSYLRSFIELYEPK